MLPWIRPVLSLQSRELSTRREASATKSATGDLFVPHFGIVVMRKGHRTMARARAGGANEGMVRRG